MDATARFDWDEGNRQKCAKHGVTIEEIERIFDDRLQTTTDLTHSVLEVRARAVGLTPAGRHVFVVYTIRERDGHQLIRPISARYMHRKEVKRYEETRTQAQEVPAPQDR